jgi:hypothetical protein
MGVQDGPVGTAAHLRPRRPWVKEASDEAPRGAGRPLGAAGPLQAASAEPGDRPDDRRPTASYVPAPEAPHRTPQTRKERRQQRRSEKSEERAAARTERDSPIVTPMAVQPSMPPPMPVRAPVQMPSWQQEPAAVQQPAPVEGRSPFAPPEPVMVPESVVAAEPVVAPTDRAPGVDLPWSPPVWSAAGAGPALDETSAEQVPPAVEEIAAAAEPAPQPEPELEPEPAAYVADAPTPFSEIPVYAPQPPSDFQSELAALRAQIADLAQELSAAPIVMPPPADAGGRFRRSRHSDTRDDEDYSTE